MTIVKGTVGMRRFSIKDLERFSGIKAHTIRVWENRYGILNPERTPAGIRVYTLEQVKVLLDISLLIDNGFKISSLAKVSSQNLDIKTNSLLTQEGRYNKAVYNLIISMYTSDVDGFENALNEAVKNNGIDITINAIIIPFLEKVELLSYKDSSIEAHFAVTAIRRKLMVGIESIPASPRSYQTVLLFLPKGEHYDLLLLYMTYQLKKKGDRILYLGTNISDDNLKKALLEKRPGLVYTYLSSRHTYDPAGLIAFLKEHLPETTLFVAEEENMTRKSNYGNARFFHFRNSPVTLMS